MNKIIVENETDRPLWEILYHLHSVLKDDIDDMVLLSSKYCTCTLDLGWHVDNKKINFHFGKNAKSNRCVVTEDKQEKE